VRGSSDPGTATLRTHSDYRFAYHWLKRVGYFQRTCSLRPLSSTNSNEFEISIALLDSVGCSGSRHPGQGSTSDTNTGKGQTGRRIAVQPSQPSTNGPRVPPGLTRYDSLPIGPRFRVMMRTRSFHSRCNQPSTCIPFSISFALPSRTNQSISPSWVRAMRR